MGTAREGVPYFSSLILGAAVAADGNSQLERLWDAAAAGLCNIYDAYGWGVPAVLLSMVFLGLRALLAWALEDLPVDLEVFQGFGGIFRWMRSRWREKSRIEHAGTLKARRKDNRSGLSILK